MGCSNHRMLLPAKPQNVRAQGATSEYLTHAQNNTGILRGTRDLEKKGDIRREKG
jgi:hypothetical protein